MDYAYNLQKVKFPVNYADLPDKKDKLDQKLKDTGKVKPKKIKQGKDIGPTLGC